MPSNIPRAMSDRVNYSDTITGEYITPTMRQEDERRNVFEDVVAEENVFQFVGSANGHLTTARSVTAKAYATQCLGDASETTIQQISKDRSGITVKKEHPNHQQQTKLFQGPGRTVD
ncbi:hypothetical protein N7478_002035 [Penicillium angulare]|uniref:uncharacterized protein n=1 Tax=Penicillium angulare TaxID=116970 RepID=UPI002540223A|nr:uncharacterized protein N7478_002035 [Penicillium angulare]KAJ5289005.1 hypothetical protein N7478_002035 [Penicillium angulare]